MMNEKDRNNQRRLFLIKAAAVPIVMGATGLGAERAVAATPECNGDKTPRQTPGPFYKPQSPQRASLLESGAEGSRMLLTGRVLTTKCEPVAGALLDFWHCDTAGNYDNAAYRYRGHQFAGQDGSFSLETITPGLYPGRTRHIHVIVHTHGQKPLVTQLYFPGEASNRDDFIYDSRLLMQMAGNRARFEFVLDVRA